MVVLLQSPRMSSDSRIVRSPLLGIDFEILAQDSGGLERKAMHQLRVTVIADVEGVECGPLPAQTAGIIPEPVEQPVRIAAE